MEYEEAYELFKDLGNIKISNRDLPAFTRMIIMDKNTINQRITISINEEPGKTKIKIKPLL